MPKQLARVGMWTKNAFGLPFDQVCGAQSGEMVKACQIMLSKSHEIDVLE